MLTRLLDRLALLPDRTHANLIWCLRPALSRPQRSRTLPLIRPQRRRGCISVLMFAPAGVPADSPLKTIRSLTAHNSRAPFVLYRRYPHSSFLSVHISTSAPSPEATRYAPHYSKPFRPQTARLGPKQPAPHSHCGIVRKESRAPDTDAGSSAVTQTRGLPLSCPENSPATDSLIQWFCSLPSSTFLYLPLRRSHSRKRQQPQVTVLAQVLRTQIGSGPPCRP